MSNLYLLFAARTKNHQLIQAHKRQNRFQMPQHNSPTHQASHRPQHPTPQQRGSLPINLHILQTLVCRSNQPEPKDIQEHIRYIKTNNPQSAYAQHILHNQRTGKLIAEQSHGEPNPLFQLAFEHPPPSPHTYTHTLQDRASREISRKPDT